jgi:hypothetical protein
MWNRGLRWSEEIAIPLKTGQEVVHVDVTRFSAHLIDAHPACLADFLGIFDARGNLFLDIVKVVFSYGESLVSAGQNVVEGNTRLFVGFPDSTVDIGLPTLFMTFGEGPFVRFSASDEEDSVKRSDTDTSIYFLGGCLIATKCLGKCRCYRIHADNKLA